MKLELIPAFQWYRRLLRRFESVFKRQDDAKALLEAVRSEIAVLRQQNELRMSEIQQRQDALLAEMHRLHHGNYAIEQALWTLRDRPFSSEVEKQSAEYQRLHRLHTLLHLRDVDGGTLIRTGRPHDGGYLMLDEFKPGMAAYSFGICDDVSWDKSMAERGIECFMYDHTIDELPEEHELFHWSKEGICGDVPVEHCRTLADFITANGHEERNDLILKMDVEGAEWDAIAAASSETLSQFSQIVFELHDVYSSALHERICGFLSKLNETHQPVWIHGNYHADYARIDDVVVPWALEVLYVRRRDHQFADSTHFYPLAQDMANNISRNDIRLGVWNVQ